MKKRVLFVDDETMVLDGYRRMLRTMRHEWEMSFATSGQEALEILGQRPHDVIVSDMRMPGMDGSQLLTEVSRRHPGLVRIVLSGHSDKEMIMKSVLVAHQYLSKPCDADKIKSVIARSCALRDLLAQDAIVDIVSRMQRLPSLPCLYLEIMDEMRSPVSSLQKVGEIIAKDVSMTAKILQLTNSTFFGLAEHVSSPARAVNLLGMDTIKALVLTAHVFSHLPNDTQPGLSLEALWEHSTKTAVLSKAIAKGEKQEKYAIDDAFVVGLLHDLGKIVLATNLPEVYRDVISKASHSEIPFWQLEERAFGTTHAQVGAYLMGLWGLPNPVVEAIAYHHHPGLCLSETFSALTAVHVADFLEHERNTGKTDKNKPQLDLLHFSKIGMHDRIPAWRSIE